MFIWLHLWPGEGGIQEWLDKLGIELPQHRIQRSLVLLWPRSCYVARVLQSLHATLRLHRDANGCLHVSALLSLWPWYSWRKWWQLEPHSHGKRCIWSSMAILCQRHSDTPCVLDHQAWSVQNHGVFLREKNRMVRELAPSPSYEYHGWGDPGSLPVGGQAVGIFHEVFPKRWHQGYSHRQPHSRAGSWSSGPWSCRARTNEGSCRMEADW